MAAPSTGGNSFSLYDGTLTVTDEEGEQSSAPVQSTVLPVLVPQVTTTLERSSPALLGTGLVDLVPLVRRRRA